MYKLSENDRRELKRLTQKANRRIESAMRAYEKEGLQVIPRALSGGKIQIREQYQAGKSAYSRSTKFGSKEDFRRHLNELRRFESPDQYRRVDRIPTLSEYNRIQQSKVQAAVNTALGVDISDKLQKKLSRMSAPQLSKFWNTFERNASRKGHPYSSDVAMTDALEEFFGDDIDNLIEV